MPDKKPGPVTVTITAIIVVPLFLLYAAWTSQTLWNWFMPPIFGLPVLTLAQALGIDLVVSWFTFQLHGGHGPDWTKKQINKRMAYWVATPPLLLSIGWVATHFI